VLKRDAWKVDESVVKLVAKLAKKVETMVGSLVDLKD
jgi:hypothetical protein